MTRLGTSYCATTPPLLPAFEAGRLCGRARQEGVSGVNHSSCCATSRNFGYTEVVYEPLSMHQRQGFGVFAVVSA